MNATDRLDQLLFEIFSHKIDSFYTIAYPGKLLVSSFPGLVGTQANHFGKMVNLCIEILFPNYVICMHCDR